MGSRPASADYFENPMKPASPTSPRKVACPSCGKEVVWVTTNPYRPFCSERCKNIDLGAWATERYRVAATEEPHPEDQSE
jgi:hypothetical protein